MKRRVNTVSDIAPSVGHIYNAKTVFPYLKRDTSMLDIGCWTGQLYRAMSNSDVKYTGIDISSQAIQKAKLISPQGKWFVGSVLKLPFRDKMFGVVTLFDVIEHIPKGFEERCIKEIRRVMKKNGIIFLSTPADNFLSKASDPAFFLIGHRHYNMETLQKIFKKGNFKVSRSWTTGGFVYVSQYLIHLLLKHIFGIFVQINGKSAIDDLNQEKGFLTHYLIAKTI